MAIGRIASLLSSLSPSADAAAAAASATEELPQGDHFVAPGSAQTSTGRKYSQGGDNGDIASQLQTMVSAIRTLNDNAIQQGAAVAVSPVGDQLRSAVTGLGHLLAAVDATALANGAAQPAREAAAVMDSVESGLAGTQAAAEQVVRNLPAEQARNAQDATDRFQSSMSAAIRQVRGALSGLNLGD